MSGSWLGGPAPQSNPIDKVNAAARQRFHPAPLTVDREEQLRLERLACEQLATAIFAYAGMRVVFELIHAEGNARITVLDTNELERPYQWIMRFLVVHYNGMATAIVKRTVYQRLLAMQNDSYLARAAELQQRLVGHHVEFRPRQAPEPHAQPQIARLVGSTPLVVGVLPALLPGTVDIVHLRWGADFDCPASLTDIRVDSAALPQPGPAHIEQPRSLDAGASALAAETPAPGRMPPALGNGAPAEEEPPYWLLPALEPLRTVPEDATPAWAPVPMPELPPEMAAELRRNEALRAGYERLSGHGRSAGPSYPSHPSRPSQPPTASRKSTAEDPWSQHSQLR